MKKLALMAAMSLVMIMVAVAPSIAGSNRTSDQEAESGDVDQSFNVTGGGDNGNQCTNISGTANTGNSQNQISIIQSNDSAADDIELEDSGSGIEVSGSSSVECEQSIEQSTGGGKGKDGKGKDGKGKDGKGKIDPPPPKVEPPKGKGDPPPKALPQKAKAEAKEKHAKPGRDRSR